ncbi:unnamed protein product [Peronospora destructor]|uniref:CREG-like beta-barrel domain-containing protein n=1 Tax=Peronospora destructor TaxID=86335 RepID=A0AAV0UT59_9STRA|nr:unnamed protein product [Peronospora destructor]
MCGQHYRQGDDESKTQESIDLYIFVCVCLNGIGYSKENSTGEIFFYITPMDATGADLSVNSTASVAITMIQKGEYVCKMDVEDPTCWKLTLTGKVVPVFMQQRHDAEKVLFS